jgi:DNA-binding CsgD family transcriptional regulator
LIGSSFAPRNLRYMINRDKAFLNSRNETMNSDSNKSVESQKEILNPPINQLDQVPLSQLGEVLSRSEAAQELIEEIERFNKLPDILKDYSEELRKRLNVDYVILNEHHWQTGTATTLADSAVPGFNSRSDYDHSLKTFDPLLRLAGTNEGIQLIVDLNISPNPNQMCIQDLHLFDNYPLLKDFKSGWPWHTDRAMAFTPLVFGEEPFPGAVGCISSSPRIWSKEDCEIMLEAAKRMSRIIIKERSLDRLVRELQLKVREYFKRNLPKAEELTEGETRVLVVLIRDGSENKEISEEIGSSERVVKKHIVNMLEKTGCKNRTQLALWGNERLKTSEE